MLDVLKAASLYVLRVVAAMIGAGMAAIASTVLWAWLDGDPGAGLLIAGFAAGSVWTKMIGDD